MRLDNLVLLNALLFVLENGCNWRALPREFGRWHTVYMRLSRWSKAGVIERVFARLQQEQILAVRLEIIGLESTSIKVHPDGTGARKKRTPSHWQITRRRHDQGSSGRRVCSGCAGSGG